MATQYASNSIVRTFDLFRNSRVVLELIEGSLQHVFWINFFHSQQIQHHVVCQVKRTVQRIRLSLQCKHTRSVLRFTPTTIRQTNAKATSYSHQAA